MGCGGHGCFRMELPEEGRHFEFRDLSTEIPVVALLLSFLSLESFY